MQHMMRPVTEPSNCKTHGLQLVSIFFYAECDLMLSDDAELWGALASLVLIAQLCYLPSA